MSDFDRLINASDLTEWIVESFPDWCEGDVRSILDHIYEMPTHTTPSNTLGALDCVSREDLTKGIETYFGDLPIAVHYDMLALAQKLPSVQPESCEYYALCRHGRDENRLRTDLGICDYCYEDSDGCVKPIEKNCHAFIRFGMNGWELSLKANGWHGSAKIMYCPMCGRELKNDK